MNPLRSHLWEVHIDTATTGCPEAKPVRKLAFVLTAESSIESLQEELKRIGTLNSEIIEHRLPVTYLGHVANPDLVAVHEYENPSEV